MIKSEFFLPQDGGLIEAAARNDILHRYEKIRTHVYPHERAGVQYASDRIVQAIREFESSQQLSNWNCEEPEPFVLGLTADSTPQELRVATYRYFKNLENACNP